MARLIKSEKEVEGRYEEVWTLVEEDALDQWPAGPGDVVGRPAARLDGYEKARGMARYTGDLQLPGTLHAALLRSPFARCRVKRIDFAAAAAAPGVLGVLGPGEVDGVGGRGELRGKRGGRRRRRDVRAGRSGRSPDRRRVGRARAAPRRRRGRAAGLARGRDPPLRARRLRGRDRRGRRGGRRRVPDADAQPQPARDPPVRLPVARRRARRLRLDPVHLGDAQRGRGRSRAAARQGARHLRVHGRRLRRQGGARQLDSARRRAREADRAPGGVRRHAPRRERRRRQPQRDEAACHGRRPRRRHAHRPRRRVHVRARMGRLAGTDGRPGAAALRLRQRAHRRARSQAESAADGGLPRARLRRGHVVARVPPGQARRPARGRPARAAEAELRARRHDGRPSVLLEGADGVLPASRAALGAPPRGARPLGRDLETRDGHGEPDLVRRRRPAELCVGPARLGRERERRHRDAGHRNRHPDRDGADRS